MPGHLVGIASYVQRLTEAIPFGVFQDSTFHPAIRSRGGLLHVGQGVKGELVILGEPFGEALEGRQVGLNCPVTVATPALSHRLDVTVHAVAVDVDRALPLAMSDDFADIADRRCDVLLIPRDRFHLGFKIGQV